MSVVLRFPEPDEPMEHQPSRAIFPLTDAKSDAENSLLALSTATNVKWPWRAVQRLAGSMTGGTMVLLEAVTGSGKTAFGLECARGWAEAGVGVGYNGTEQTSEQLWQRLACAETGIPAYFARSAAFDEMDHDTDEGQTFRAAVVKARDRLGLPAADVRGSSWSAWAAHEFGTALRDLTARLGDRLHFDREPMIQVGPVRRYFEWCVSHGFRAVVLDHLGRVQGDGEGYAPNKRAIQRITTLAAQMDLIVVCIAQVNRAGRAGDVLASHLPPELHHVEGGGYNEHEMAIALGLWQPMRDRRTSETPEQWDQLKRDVRAKERPKDDVLDIGATGVTLLKHRNAPPTARVGAECRLDYVEGRLFDRVPDPAASARDHGIRTTASEG